MKYNYNQISYFTKYIIILNTIQSNPTLYNLTVQIQSYPVHQTGKRTIGERERRDIRELCERDWQRYNCIWIDEKLTSVLMCNLNYLIMRLRSIYHGRKQFHKPLKYIFVWIYFCGFFCFFVRGCVLCLCECDQFFFFQQKVICRRIFIASIVMRMRNLEYN